MKAAKELQILKAKGEADEIAYQKYITEVRPKNLPITLAAFEEKTRFRTQLDEKRRVDLVVTRVHSLKGIRVFHMLVKEYHKADKFGKYSLYRNLEIIGELTDDASGIVFKESDNSVWNFSFSEFQCYHKAGEFVISTDEIRRQTLNREYYLKEGERENHYKKTIAKLSVGNTFQYRTRGNRGVILTVQKVDLTGGRTFVTIRKTYQNLNEFGEPVNNSVQSYNTVKGELFCSGRLLRIKDNVVTNLSFKDDKISVEVDDGFYLKYLGEVKFTEKLKAE